MPPKGAEAEGIGGSKGGANTKIHALVDARGRAVRILLGPGNRHDCVAAPELVAGQDSRTILADKAYGSAAFRDLLGSLGLQACIPPKANETRPAKYNKHFYLFQGQRVSRNGRVFVNPRQPFVDDIISLRVEGLCQTAIDTVGVRRWFRFRWGIRVHF